MRQLREDLLDTDPITLAEASRLILRGVVTVSALRAEIRRGTLSVEKIGKNLYTTPAAIREMRERCRVKPATQVSRSAKAERGPPGSSTAGTADELAALRAAMHALKNGTLQPR